MVSSSSQGHSPTRQIEALFRHVGVLREGHFLLTSGLHSPTYWEKFRVLQYPEHTGTLCAMIADRFRAKEPTVVVGPTTGGVILAFETARQLGIRGIFAEKDGDRRVLRRDFAIRSGEKVLVVDDVLTTGKSVIETLDAVRSMGGDVVGVGVMIDRSESAPSFGTDLFSCLRAPSLAYRPEACPLCARGIVLTKPGSS